MARKSAQVDLLRMGLELAAKKGIDHVLYVGDVPLPPELLGERGLRKKIVQAVSSEARRAAVAAQGLRTLLVPAFDLARTERFKIALFGGVAEGRFRKDDVVLGMVGQHPTSLPDTILITDIAETSAEGSYGTLGETGIPSAVLEAVLDLAIEIGLEGWEGHPVGTIIVVGDSATVLEKSRPLTLNPFQGYSEAEKNLVNPAVRDAIKNFAVLDGAFVVREDGVALAAGRYLNFEEEDLDVPLGVGARHLAAAGISRDTGAIALVVSQTSGKVRVFRRGKMVLEIDAKARRR